MALYSLGFEGEKPKETHILALSHMVETMQRINGFKGLVKGMKLETESPLLESEIHLMTSVLKNELGLSANLVRVFK